MIAIRRATKILLRGRGLKTKLFCTKIVEFRPHAEQINANQECSRRGCGAGPSRRAILRKISSFNAILITFRTFLKRYADLNG